MFRFAIVSLFSLVLVGCGSSHSGHSHSGHSKHGHEAHGFCHDHHAVCKTIRKAKRTLHGHSHD